MREQKVIRQDQGSTFRLQRQYHILLYCLNPRRPLARFHRRRHQQARNLVHCIPTWNILRVRVHLGNLTTITPTPVWAHVIHRPEATQPLHILHESILLVRPDKFLRRAPVISGKFSCAAGCCHIFPFIAFEAISLSGRWNSMPAVQLSASSAKPCAIFAIVLAVAGAIKSKCARSANSTCAGFQPSSSSYKSVTTGWRDSGFKRQRRHESQGVRRHHHAHARPAFDQQAGQIHRFARCD